MNCNEVKLCLSSFQDNELAAGAKARVQAHLDECDNCRIEFLELEKICRGINKLRELEPAQNFTSLVMSQIKEKKNHRLFALPTLAYSLVFILFFFLGLLVTMNLKNVTTPDRDEMYVSNILMESQNLGLINIQDNTFAMLYDEGKKHGQ
jgi:predicted anti-sigma-YlaC factor YlaD